MVAGLDKDVAPHGVGGLDSNCAASSCKAAVGAESIPRYEWLEGRVNLGIDVVTHEDRGGGAVENVCIDLKADLGW